MSIKLYSYGDSHAAGHELGSDPNLGKAWLKENFGFEDRQKAKKQRGEEYFSKVKNKWLAHIKNHCNAELSYAGQYANLIGAELVNRAVPGSSNDWSAIRLLEDLENITSDDIVMFSLCTHERFLSGQGEDVTRTQVQWQPLKVQRILYKYGPSGKSFALWTQAIVHMVKNIANTIIIKTTDVDISVNGVETINVTAQPFSQFAMYTAGHDDIRYPAGHIHEHYHKLYAEYLKDLI